MSYYPFFLIVFILILSLPILMITTSKILRFIIGYTNNTSDSIYECGEPRVQNSWTKIPISYYGKTKRLAENYVSKNIKNYCIGRIFSTANKDQRKNYLVPDLKEKIKNTRKKIILKNLNHYRDFVSMEIISKIINILLKKQYIGFINIGSGKGIYLKDIAKIILKKYKKKASFKDNKNPTYLIADTRKLKKITKINFNSNIKDMIFSKTK